MSNFKKSLIVAGTFAALFGFAPFALAVTAPISSQQRNIVPATTATYYLGTTTPSTKSWKGIIADQLCLTGDICRSTWPGAAGGTPGGSQGQLQYYGAGPAFAGVSTTTLINGSGVTFSGGTPVIIGSSPVTISSSGGGTGLSTTTPIAGSNLLVYTASGAGAAYGAATTTLGGGTTGLSFSNSPIVIGASPSALSGTLALANGGTATTTFYNKGLVYSDGTKLTQPTGSGVGILNWDNANGRLGIGTSTPIDTLSIAGNVQQWGSGFQHFGQSVSPDTVYCGPGTQCLGYFGTDNTAVGVSIEVGNINPGAAAYSYFGLVNNQTDASGTNYAGLGLNSSNYSDQGFGPAFAIPSLLSLQNSMGPVQLWSPKSTGYVTIGAGGTALSNEIARFLSNGNVGIGTTTPSAKLSISNTVNDPAGQALVRIASTTGGTSTTTLAELDNTGQLFNNNTKQGYSGILPPATPFSFTYATSSWSGTTTISIESGMVAGETFNGVRCYTDVGTVNVDVYHNTTHLSLLNASTTNNFFTWSSNNSVAVADKVKVDIGTPASSPTKLTCSILRSYAKQ